MLSKINWSLSSNVQKGDIDMFPCLQDVVANASVNIRELFAVISQHLKELNISFDKYFPKTADPRKGNFWIVNPFANYINSCHLNAIEKESLIELPAIPRWCPSRKTCHCHNFGFRLKTNILSSVTKQWNYCWFLVQLTYLRKAFHRYLSRPNREIVWKSTLYFALQKLH